MNEKKKENLQKKIILLNKTRKIFNPRKHSGICGATRDAANTLGFDDFMLVRNEVVTYISRALGRYSFLSGWIADKTGEDIHTVFRDHKKLTATRLAWIDWMIQCYTEDINKLK